MFQTIRTYCLTILAYLDFNWSISNSLWILFEFKLLGQSINDDSPILRYPQNI